MYIEEHAFSRFVQRSKICILIRNRLSLVAGLVRSPECHPIKERGKSNIHKAIGKGSFSRFAKIAWMPCCFGYALNIYQNMQI